MHKSVIGALLSVTLCSSVVAYDFYIGGIYKKQEFGFSEQGVSLDFDFKSLGILGGYHINEYFTVEGRASFGSDGPDFRVGNVTYQSDIEQQLDVLIKSPYELAPNVAIYGFAGLTYTKIEGKESWESYNYGRFTDTYTESDTVFTYGIGGSYQFNEAWSVFVEYQGYGDFEDSDEGTKVELDHDSFNFGVSYKF